MTEFDGKTKRFEVMLNTRMEALVNRMGKVLAYGTIVTLAVLGIALVALFLGVLLR